ncbi:MAG TPA: GatB/YqeY domain-containing protein [Longimicrobiales bacterium]|nr:GatB/YqeY domain-containing protein [Longimicrobiales bacterium]
MAESSLLGRIRADLNTARKERDRTRMDALGMLIAESQNRRIEKGAELTDDDIVALITGAVKRRREAAEQMRAGGRDELATKEEAEAAILQSYLPEQLSEDEVRGLVREAIAAGATDLGAIMKSVMPRTRGRFDGKELNRIAREELGG